MENNKYYIPNLEEFHVGFEYEHLSSLTNVWTKQIVNRDVRLICFQDYIITEQVRVKYLDKEDIESLGFKYYDYVPNGDHDYRWWDGYKKDIYEIRYCNNWTNYNTIICRNNRLIFEGNIKNKSELVKLLKQLNIK